MHHLSLCLSAPALKLKRNFKCQCQLKALWFTNQGCCFPKAWFTCSNGVQISNPRMSCCTPDGDRERGVCANIVWPTLAVSWGSFKNFTGQVSLWDPTSKSYYFNPISEAQPPQESPFQKLQFFVSKIIGLKFVYLECGVIFLPHFIAQVYSEFSNSSHSVAWFGVNSTFTFKNFAQTFGDPSYWHCVHSFTLPPPTLHFSCHVKHPITLKMRILRPDS